MPNKHSNWDVSSSQTTVSRNSVFKSVWEAIPWSFIIEGFGPGHPNCATTMQLYRTRIAQDDRLSLREKAFILQAINSLEVALAED
jgi:hypothetical protein